MTALPGKYNINARQGTPLHRIFTYTDDEDVPINIDGYTAFMPVRTRSGKFLFELDTSDNGITIDGPSGTIEISVNATLMRDQPAITAFYDLVLVPAGNMAEKFTLLNGWLNIERRVPLKEENDG
jgi:hypothetical protein